ncbi:hypothetical protein CLV24_13025 [Pontibacter ummariensis]|uniref:Uncharacterized protein n=1 Tax=Pontibacter ummariensis TaxID=1610492 RepID=A0A239KPK5_9BACT|nr:hypothetical protein [Pontibacter ummariensis]PRY05345.1 hypothetical protein CLV24_13025 [Pontibacter ummariensis]SNT19608.1 hypothetical protein SAMN06296052_13025 [Pontibacter ummariensis]
MKYQILFVLLLIMSCSQPSTKTEPASIEKISLVGYSYREKPTRDGYDFYLASLHELVASDNILTVVKRDSFNSPLHAFTTTDENLAKIFPKLAESYPADTSLFNLNPEETGIYHGFDYMLLLITTDGRVRVVSFTPRRAEGALKIVSDSLLRYQVDEGMRAKGMDTVSLIATFDSLARKHVLPLHPLPPNSLPPPVYKGQKQ